jgi:hypothetical protein
VARSVRRYAFSSGVALIALLAGPIAGAQASDSTIVGTVNHWLPAIVRDENAVKAGLTAYTHHKVKPLVKALNHEVGDLHTLQHTVSGETASSAKGHQAKVKIVKGLGLIAQAYGAHGCGLLIDRNSVLGGNKSGDLTGAVVQGLDARITTITFERESLAAAGAPTAR